MAIKQANKIKLINKIKKMISNPFSTKGTKKNTNNGHIIINKKVKKK